MRDLLVPRLLKLWPFPAGLLTLVMGLVVWRGRRKKAAR